MPQTVLWATDGSDAADRALPFVRDLAGGAGRLVVLHCDELSSLPVPRASELVTRIRAQAGELHTAGGEAAEVQIVKGLTTDVPSAIAAAAEREHADLIVAGSRGHSMVSGLIVGSVTQRLLAIAPCPVLVVPAAGAGSG
jgi:nucleotide-binding universal stress UspA family protein